MDPSEAAMTFLPDSTEPFNPGWGEAARSLWGDASRDQRRRILQDLSPHENWATGGPMILDALTWLTGPDLARTLRALAGAPAAVARPLVDGFLQHPDPAVRHAAAYAWVRNQEAPAELLADPREEVAFQHLVHQYLRPEFDWTPERAARLSTLNCFEPMGPDELGLFQEAGFYPAAARPAVVRYLEAAFRAPDRVPHGPFGIHRGLHFLSRGSAVESVQLGLAWCERGLTWLGPALLGLCGAAGRAELDRFLRNPERRALGVRGLAIGPDPDGEERLRGWLASPDLPDRHEAAQALLLRASWDPAAFGALLAKATLDQKEATGQPYDAWWQALCWSHNGPFSADFGPADRDGGAWFLPRDRFPADCPGARAREAMFYRAALGLAAHGTPELADAMLSLLGEISPDTEAWASFWSGQLETGGAGTRATAARWLAWRDRFERLAPHRERILAGDCRHLPALLASEPSGSWRAALLGHPDLQVRLEALAAFRPDLDGPALEAQVPWLRAALESPAHRPAAARTLASEGFPGLTGSLCSALADCTDPAMAGDLLSALLASPGAGAHDQLMAVLERPAAALRRFLPELLERLGGERAEGILDDLLRHPLPPQGAGACLGRLGTPRSLQILAACRDRAPACRAQAAAGLSIHPDPRAWAACLPLLQDPHPRVRRAAILSLARCRREEAEAVLWACAASEDLSVCLPALWALCRRPGVPARTLVRLIRELHPDPWPGIPIAEGVERPGKDEARHAAEFLVRALRPPITRPRTAAAVALVERIRACIQTRCRG